MLSSITTCSCVLRRLGLTSGGGNLGGLPGLFPLVDEEGLHGVRLNVVEDETVSVLSVREEKSKV